MSIGGKEVARDLSARLVNNGKGVKSVKNHTTFAKSK